MKKSTLAILLAFIGFIAQAQIPNGYYNNAANKTGDELRSALHDIIDNHTEISYGQIWNAFWSTDNKGNNVVWDMYSDGANYSYNYYSKTGDQCGTYDSEGDCYNREHSWPKSWFTGKEDCTPGRDLHHIFPTDGFVNAQRSSYPYGEVQSATWTSENGSKLGSCNSSLGYTGTVFEPIDQYKGDFARAYFYMSTRYYGEDSNWGSSGMTEGANLKSWAVTMLLRWSDNDPVSQKEIDRNNAVYGIQGNRNPFIDHPEYAHLIWEPGWSGTPYAITCATGLSHGSISAPSTAVAGTMVTLTANPNQGYELDTWTVTKTNDANTTISVNGNTFVMPAYPVTVSATFKSNANYYTITKGTVSHGTFTVSTTSAQSGTTINLTANPASGYILYAWYVYKTDDVNTTVPVSTSGNNGTFTMPAYNVTVLASFAQGSAGGYVKVTSEPSDWSGEYLIVYEAGNKAFNGGLSSLDATSNTISVTINDNTIASTTTTDAANFTIAQSGNSYTIKSASGYYIGQTSNANGMVTNQNTQYTNSISYNSGIIDIVSSGGAYLRYNATSSQERFRYFKSSTYTDQQAIQLYKKTASTVTTPTHTIQFNPNGGSESSYTQTVNEFEPTALQANSFTRQGYAFDSWNTAANGSGTTYFNGATVTLLNDLVLYAQWAPTFTVTCNSVTNGTISASPTTAVAGATITLTATPASGYELGSWTVTDALNNTIEVTENQFDMPASNVTVSATFTEQSVVSGDFEKVTENLSDWSGEYLIVYETDKKAFNGALTTLDANNNAISVDISNNTIEATPTNLASQFTIAKSGNNYTIKSASGYYIGATSNTNIVNSSTSSAYTNSINYSDGSINIIGSGGAYLRYNSGNTRFRYYQSSTYTSQKAIQLYKRVTSATPTTYTITFHPNGGTGSNYTQTVNANEATALTTNTFTRSGFNFSGWNTQADGNGTAYTDQQTVTLTADINLYAQWTSQSTSYTYHCVTSTDQLVAGRTYLIVNTANQKALGTTQNNNNRSAASVTVESDMIASIGNDVCELTLGGQSGAWTFYDANKNGYLCATKGSNNYLRTQATLDNYGKWAITLDASHNATIKTIASDAGRHTIMYNNGNTIFSCYESGQQAVQLYIRSENDITQNTTYQNLVLFDFDQCTIHSGITLTVTGTATCNDPNNLIIEDGAQFVHHNSGVQATFKKGIQAYTEGKSDGWYTIASPFISFTPGQVAAGSYDLYAYVENSQLEWYNYRTHQNSFPTDPYKGYLYAHNPAATLQMTGTLSNGDYTNTVDLSYANNNADLKGFNLLGNPTAHEITFSKTASVSDGYYYLSNSDTWIYEGSCTVPAGRGFLVKANATGQKVTLNPSAKRGELVETDYGTSQLKIDVDGEQAYVKLTEGVSMPLLSFKGKTQRIFLERDDKAYVMLVKDDAETIRLNYQPNTQDQHKLSVSANELELDYLHLTDRLTGADIDLLVTPSYSFESNENDPVSRFLLRFSPIGNEMEEDAFAYYADGKINIMDVTASATLQIIDLTGRVIVSKTGARTVSTDGMTSGIYTVRLITPENVRTQKIIIN